MMGQRIEKEEMRRELRRWRERGGGEEYKRLKREHKELCIRKKQEENERKR